MFEIKFEQLDAIPIFFVYIFKFCYHENFKFLVFFALISGSIELPI